jgi:hypothetical protein
VYHSETQKQQKIGNWHCGNSLIGLFQKIHKNATKCNETLSKWCKNKHGASKIIDTFETYQQVFESMDQDMDLTIGSLNFRVGSLGSIRLSDPVKPGPSASKSKIETMSESSEGSSSEVNSPVSFAEIETEERKIAEGDETMENFDLEVQLEDLMICHDDTSDKSIDTWKTGLELHEDDSSIFLSFNSKFDNWYQVLAI